MAYGAYVQPVEIPPPPNPRAYHEEFFNDFGMVEVGGQVQLVHVAGFANQRWNMVKQFVAKAKPGSAGNSRPLQGQYIHEAIDDKHRMPDLVVAMRKLYQQIFPASFHQKNSLFYRWMDGYILYFPEDVKLYLKRSFKGLPEETYETFVTTGVEYKNSPMSRISSLIFFIKGLMYQKGKLFDTRSNKTHFSGTGWAIYVVSPGGLWYAGSHVVGKFQHSSFLGGRPLLAAGEIQVLDGVPKVITAKSGHYTPTETQFMEGLNRLKTAGVNMSELKIGVKDKATNQKVQLVASAFLVNKALRDRHSVW